MRNLVLIFLTFVLANFSLSYGQNIKEQIDLFKQANDASLVIENLFISKNGYSNNAHQFVETHQLLELDLNKLNTLRTNQPMLMEFEIRYKESVFTLNLIPNNIYSSTPVKAYNSLAGSDYIAYNTNNLHFKGIVKDKPNSIASFSIVNGDVSLMISTKEHGNLELVKAPNDNNEYYFYKTSELIDRNYPACEFDDATAVDNVLKQQIENSITERGSGCIEIHFFCDYQMYLDFNEDPVQLENYVSGFFAQVAALYSNESIELKLGPILSYNTSEDNYSDISAAAVLNKFIGAVNSNYNGNIAHLLSTKNTNLGGLAIYNQLCGSAPYAFSNIRTYYSNFPSYSWTVTVVAHETGHNLGSRHTHWCGWPGGAIDNCAPLEEGPCSNGGIPQSGGTIMSYCHNQPVGINFANGFGSLPGNEIRNSVSLAPCINGCFVDTRPDLAVENLSVSPSSVTWGSNVNVNCSIKNIGEVGSKPSRLAIYISTDTIVGNGDTKISTINLAPLNAGSEIQVSESFLMPSFLENGGVYNIIVWADYGQYNVEVDEVNNVEFKQIFVDEPTADLTIQSASSAFSIVNRNQPFSVNLEIINDGNLSSNSNFYVGAYLSEDTILDFSDNFINSRFVPALSSNENHTTDLSITIPTNTDLGNYYLILCADSRLEIPESNEENNCFRIPLEVADIPADLIINNVTISDPELDFQETFTVSFDVENIGLSTAFFSNAIIVFSEDDVYDNLDIILGYEAINTISQNQTESYSKEFVLPNRVFTGSYKLLVCADHTNLVAEDNEFNNCYFVDVAVNNPPHDFAATAMDIDEDSIIAGETLTGTLQISNISNSQVPVNGINHNFYISSDTIYDTLDVQLNSSYNPVIVNIPPGSSETVVNSLYTDEDLSSGDYYILGCANTDSAVFEFNKTNNCIYKAIHVEGRRNDIYVLNPEVNNANYPGSRATVNLDVINDGNVVANNFCLEYYFSNDAILDTNDLLLSDDFVTSLLPGAISSEYASLTLPGDIVAGSYYLLFYVDCEELINETNEDNNVSAYEINLAPSDFDIQIFNETISGNIYPSGEVELDFKLRNFGEDRIYGSSYVKCYFSNDVTIDNDDVLVSEIFVSSITSNAFGSSQESFFYVPPNFSSSTNLILVADSENDFFETNEENNIVVIPIELEDPKLDLIINVDTVYGEFNLGSRTNIELSLKNEGSFETPPFKLNFYISEDSILDEGDNFWAQRTYEELEAGESITPYTSIELPLDIALGEKYILFALDYENNIAEYDETNNFQSYSISIVPFNRDLVIKNIYTEGRLYQDGYLRTYCTIQNTGSTTSEAHILRAVLSTDTILDNTDRTIYNEYSNFLVPNDTAFDEFNYDLSADLDTGTQYLFVCADYYNYVDETNEDNNCARHPVTFFSDQVDLQAQYKLNITSFFPLRQGETISLAVETNNLGDIVAPSSETGLVLSKDRIFDIEDVIIADINIESLNPTTTNDIYISGTIPTNLNIGDTMYILACADIYDEVNEINEVNNCEATSVVIAPHNIDLVCLYPEVTGELKTGGIIDMSTYVKNVGTNSTDEPTTCNFYLSKDTVINSFDISFGSVSGASLGNMDSVLFELTRTIPDNFSGEDRFIIVQTDKANNILEDNEKNNLNYIKIDIEDLNTSNSYSVLEHAKVFPNPNNGTFTFTAKNLSNYEFVHINIFNAIGETVNSFKISVIDDMVSKYFDLTHLESGFYFIDLINDKEEKLGTIKLSIAK